MNRNASALAAAIAATLGVSAVDAATYTATLTSVTSYSGSGSSAGNITSSTATFEYDDVTTLLSQTGGTFNVRFTITPTTTLFRHSITGLVIGDGAAAAASTYACTEGNFGGNVGASLCGNYNFGGNFANESTVTWGPGTATARTTGGDDMALGPQQSLAAYNAFNELSWVGTTLTLSNAVCNPLAPGNASGCATTGGANSGYTWTLSAVEQAPNLPVANDFNLVIDTQGIDPVNAEAFFVVTDVAGNSLGDEPSNVITGNQSTLGDDTVSGLLVTYTPNPGSFTGNDSFTYTITDNDLDTDTGTVTVEIPDVPPVLDNTSDTVANDEIATGNLLELTTPGNGSPAQHTFALVTDGTRGSCEVTGAELTYTPNDGEVGADSCVVSITDGDGDSDTATISIDVVEPTAPPPSGGGGDSGLRQDDGGSSADWLLLSLLGSGALLGRRRRRRA